MDRDFCCDQSHPLDAAGLCACRARGRIGCKIDEPQAEPSLNSHMRFKNQILMEAYVVFNATQSITEYDVCNRKEVAIEAPPEMQSREGAGM